MMKYLIVLVLFLCHDTLAKVVSDLVCAFDRDSMRFYFCIPSMFLFDDRYSLIEKYFGGLGWDLIYFPVKIKQIVLFGITVSQFGKYVTNRNSRLAIRLLVTTLIYCCIFGLLGTLVEPPLEASNNVFKVLLTPFYSGNLIGLFTANILLIILLFTIPNKLAEKLKK